MQYDYVLVNKEGKDAVDVRAWKNSIIESIKSIVPTASNTVVGKDGYSFENATPRIDGKLRLIGKQIAASCPDLFKLAGRTYFYGRDKTKQSRQLFVRKKE